MMMTYDASTVVLVALVAVLAAHLMALWRMWAGVERASRMSEERMRLLLDILERAVERSMVSPLAPLHSAERRARTGAGTGTGTGVAGVVREASQSDAGLEDVFHEENITGAGAGASPDRFEYNLTR